MKISRAARRKTSFPLSNVYCHFHATAVVRHVIYAVKGSDTVQDDTLIVPRDGKGLQHSRHSWYRNLLREGNVRTFDLPGPVHINGDWNGVEIPNGGYRAIEATRRKGASTSLVRQRWKRAGVLKRLLEQDGTRMGPARSVLLKKRAGVLISAVLPRAEMEGGWSTPFS